MIANKRLAVDMAEKQAEIDPAGGFLRALNYTLPLQIFITKQKRDTPN